MGQRYNTGAHLRVVDEVIMATKLAGSLNFQ